MTDTKRPNVRRPVHSRDAADERTPEQNPETPSTGADPNAPQATEAERVRQERARRAQAQVEATHLKLIGQWQGFLANRVKLLARFYQKSGQPAKALLALEHLATYHDALVRADARLSLGQLCEQLGDFAGAAEHYERGLPELKRNYGTRYLLHNNLGYVLSHLAAAQAQEQAASVEADLSDPRDAEAAGGHEPGAHLAEPGETHEERGSGRSEPRRPETVSALFERAEHLCREAIGIDASRPNAYKNLGIALEGQGRYVAAADAYRAAALIGPGDPRGLLHLEQLVESHPEVHDEYPWLADELTKLRQAAAARRAKLH